MTPDFMEKTSCVVLNPIFHDLLTAGVQNFL